MHNSAPWNILTSYLKNADTHLIFLKVLSALGKCPFGIVGIALCTFIFEDDPM